jgi:hypothetical protein
MTPLGDGLADRQFFEFSAQGRIDGGEVFIEAQRRHIEVPDAADGERKAFSLGEDFEQGAGGDDVELGKVFSISDKVIFSILIITIYVIIVKQIFLS